MDPVERMFKISMVVAAVVKIVVGLLDSDERKESTIVKIIQIDVIMNRQTKLNHCFHFGSRIVPLLLFGSSLATSFGRLSVDGIGVSSFMVQCRNA